MAGARPTRPFRVDFTFVGRIVHGRSREFDDVIDDGGATIVGRTLDQRSNTTEDTYILRRRVRRILVKFLLLPRSHEDEDEDDSDEVYPVDSTLKLKAQPGMYR